MTSAQQSKGYTVSAGPLQAPLRLTHQNQQPICAPSNRNCTMQYTTKQ